MVHKLNVIISLLSGDIMSEGKEAERVNVESFQSQMLKQGIIRLERNAHNGLPRESRNETDEEHKWIGFLTQSEATHSHSLPRDIPHDFIQMYVLTRIQ